MLLRHDKLYLDVTHDSQIMACVTHKGTIHAGLDLEGFIAIPGSCWNTYKVYQQTDFTEMIPSLRCI